MSLRMGTTVAGQIRKRVPDKRVAQMLDHFVQYVGSSPYLSPAVLCGIAHMQTQEGVWYPIGGTRAVPEGPGRPWRSGSVSRSAPRPASPASNGPVAARTVAGGPAPVITEAGERVALSRRGVQHGQRAHLPRN